MTERIWLVDWLVVLGLLALWGSIPVYIGPCLPEKRNDRREKKCPNNPHPHLLQALAILLSKYAGRPGTRSLPSTIAPPDRSLRGNRWKIYTQLCNRTKVFFIWTDVNQRTHMTTYEKLIGENYKDFIRLPLKTYQSLHQLLRQFSQYFGHNGKIFWLPDIIPPPW